MSWLALVLAGLCEMFGVAMMHRVNQGGGRSAVVLLLAGFGASLLLLSYAMKTIDMGTAYAIWTGIGASGGAALGMVAYGESKHPKRILFIAIILGASVGLKLAS
ncbi:MAG: multidrug efflux SMR transporter [Paenibacillaceae bacterium]|nr:multidrug efflux SMR transporter [Paenibacillaceae bacterium]